VLADNIIQVAVRELVRLFRYLLLQWRVQWLLLLLVGSRWTAIILLIIRRDKKIRPACRDFLIYRRDDGPRFNECAPAPPARIMLYS